MWKMFCNEKEEEEGNEVVWLGSHPWAFSRKLIKNPFTYFVEE